MNPRSATVWGTCGECGSPGLAFAHQFTDATAKCGFCGGRLAAVDKDLSAEAARVIVEPCRREQPSKGTSREKQRVAEPAHRPDLPKTGTPPTPTHLEAKRAAATALAEYRGQAAPGTEIVLTPELVKAGVSAGSGFNRDQLRLLGVSWPPPKGWLKRLRGKTIPAADYRTFLALKGVKPEHRRKGSWRI